MRINFSDIDRQNFRIKTGKVAGEEVYLLCPDKDFGTVWTPENRIFRSSMWNSDGELISPSFLKFFNALEKPEFPTPKNAWENEIVVKMDGSTILVSSYKGELIWRTRETISAIIHPTGAEIRGLITPEIEKWIHSNPDKTLCFEHVTPNNKIIINYPEPRLVLLNVINHADYSYFKQSELPELAKELNVTSPERYEFESDEDLVNFLNDDKTIEGFVNYFNDGQDMRKHKGWWYLQVHRLRFSLSKDAMLKLYLDSGAETVQAFRTYLISLYDYEVISGLGLENLEKADLELKEKEKDLRKLAKEINRLPRKQIAESILNLVPKNDHKFAFSVVDKGKIDDKLREDFIRKRL